MALGDSHTHIEPITRREREVLRLLSEGLSDQQIASRLFLSVGTVKWHVQNIYAKFGVERRTQAVKRAHELGMLDTAVPLHEDRLPPDTTSFVDRHLETEHILQILENPGCRLLTLVGQGGIGKTRLALHAARNTPVDFPDGKAFISLVGIASTQNLASTIANALSFSFYGADEPETQLLRYLSHKTLLLVLDNYEQLLPEVDLLGKLLEQAPGVKLLITSRERLNLREEWIVQVDGLPVTTEGVARPDASPDAVTLFVQRASQVNSRFPGAGLDMPFVTEVCRRVEGIPLAIELAAGWAGSLTAKEIAEEMNKSFQLLTTGMHNVPERHRSMQVVFEQTWARLSSHEQAVVEALSVFRGGFTREAAEQVAGADLNVLATLQDKCLIARQVSGRYEMHELLRQFGEAKLADDLVRHNAAQDRHCHYFAQLLWGKRMPIVSSGQYEIYVTLKIDIENIEQAWRWMVSHEDWEAFDLSWETVNILCHTTSQFYMGKMLFALALEQLRLPFNDKARQRAKIIALTHVAWYSFMTNQLTKGLELVEEVLALIDDWTTYDPRIYFWVLNTHTCLLWARGDYEKALQPCHMLLQVASMTEVILYDELAHFDFGIIYLRLGEFEKARTHFDHFAARGTYFERSYANNYLGQIAEVSGDLHEAQALYAKSLDLFRQLGFQWGIATALINLGRMHGRSGSLWEASACLYEALDIALDIQTPQHIVEAVAEIAYLFPAIGQSHVALSIFEFLHIHPVAWQEYASRVEQYLVELRQLASDQPIGPVHLSEFAAVDDVIAVVQASRSAFQTLGNKGEGDLEEPSHSET